MQYQQKRDVWVNTRVVPVVAVCVVLVAALTGGALVVAGFMAVAQNPTVLPGDVLNVLWGVPVCLALTGAWWYRCVRRARVKYPAAPARPPKGKPNLYRVK